MKKLLKSAKAIQPNAKGAAMKRIVTYMVVLIILTTYQLAGADSLIVDQSHVAPVNTWHNLSYYKFDQEFLPSVTELDIVELGIYTDVGARLKVTIREGSLDGPSVGTVPELAIDPGFSGLAQFVFESPIFLLPDYPYVIDLELLEGSASIASSFEEGGYPDGRMFIDEINTPTDDSDVIFQTGLTQPDVIDIESGGHPSYLNLNSAADVRVTIKGSDMFRAHRVNPGTVYMAGAIVKTAGKNGKYLCREEDDNNDGYMDLVCRMNTSALTVEGGNVLMVVVAETYDGTVVIGEETVFVEAN